MIAENLSGTIKIYSLLESTFNYTGRDDKNKLDRTMSMNRITTS
jgi:hypothetical protein